MQKAHYSSFFLYLLILVVIIIAIVFLLSKSPESQEGSKENESNESASMNTQNTPPAMEIDSKKRYSATVTTSKGTFTIEFFASETPIAVNNFVSLARKGFYNGTVFHRIIKGFMIQGGDPAGNGTGGPGYKFDDEKITRDYKRGIVAMANSGPNTNGSQFFIMHQDYDLPKSYVIFGQVAQGMNTVDAIANMPTEESGEKSKPKEKVTIENITIDEK